MVGLYLCRRDYQKLYGSLEDVGSWPKKIEGRPHISYGFDTRKCYGKSTVMDEKQSISIRRPINKLRLEGMLEFFSFIGDDWPKIIQLRLGTKKPRVKRGFEKQLTSIILSNTRYKRRLDFRKSFRQVSLQYDDVQAYVQARRPWKVQY